MSHPQALHKWCRASGSCSYAHSGLCTTLASLGRQMREHRKIRIFRICQIIRFDQKKYLTKRTCLILRFWKRGKEVEEVAKPKLTTDMLNTQIYRQFTKPFLFSAFLLTSLFTYRALKSVHLFTTLFS